MFVQSPDSGKVTEDQVEPLVEDAALLELKFIAMYFPLP